jgi:catechol 2,3-dioxygenase-like lactoylglutathione lyase family enzyme
MQRALKTARVLFACLLGCSAALEGYSAEGDSLAAPTVEFRRANLVVTDLDRALQVYRDVLGFMVDGISESSRQSYSSALVIRVDDIEAVILAVRELGLYTLHATRAETPEGDGFMEQAFVDFDGHLVVLYQLL